MMLSGSQTRFNIGFWASCCLLLVSCSSREAAQSDNPVTKQNDTAATKGVQQQRPALPQSPPATVVVRPEKQTKAAMQPLPIQIDGPAAAARKNSLDPEKILAQGIRTVQGKHLLNWRFPNGASILILRSRKWLRGKSRFV